MDRRGPALTLGYPGSAGVVLGLPAGVAGELRGGHADVLRTHGKGLFIAPAPPDYDSVAERILINILQGMW